jgi:hypothetical protein
MKNTEGVNFVDAGDGRVGVGAKHLRNSLLMENNVRSQMLCPYECLGPMHRFRIHAAGFNLLENE